MLKLTSNRSLLVRIYLAAIAMGAVLTNLPTLADTVDARCDIYPIGQDRASASLPCTFSEKDGVVYIERQDGIDYQLDPVEDRPGTYIDGEGNTAYRQAELGNVGYIYRLTNESVYVYWDALPFDFPPSESETSNADAPNAAAPSTDRPNTSVSLQNEREMVIRIEEGEFYFSELLKRGSDDRFTASNGEVKVSFDPFKGHVMVFREATGEELYNYYIDPIPTLEDPKTMCDPATESC